MIVSHLNWDSQQLREGRSALRRLQEGRFGLCDECGEEISARRLRAVPWVAFCLSGQEELDRNPRDMNEFVPEDGTVPSRAA